MVSPVKTHAIAGSETTDTKKEPSRGLVVMNAVSTGTILGGNRIVTGGYKSIADIPLAIRCHLQKAHGGGREFTFGGLRCIVENGELKLAKTLSPLEELKREVLLKIGNGSAGHIEYMGGVFRVQNGVVEVIQVPPGFDS